VAQAFQPVPPRTGKMPAPPRTSQTRKIAVRAPRALPSWRHHI